MKVKCISDNTFSISLTYGKIYEVIGIENGWYRIVDNTEEDYLFSPDYYAVKSSGSDVASDPELFILDPSIRFSDPL